MGESKPYQMNFEPIVLKELCVKVGISQSELREAVGKRLGKGVSRPTINLCLNRGYLPPTLVGFKSAVEDVIRGHARAMGWLLENGMVLTDIWSQSQRACRSQMPGDWSRRMSASSQKRRPAAAPGNPHQITIAWEVEMISQEALKHFKLFRNPFIDDIQKDADIFMSDEHRYIEAAMLDSARHGGFLAVIGEVGSGKSVMRRKVIEQLKRDGDTLVIYPQMIDKKRLTAASICDAIIQDVSSERCKAKLEDKTRQVQKLLLDRSKSGYRACLIIEEAHDLSVQTMKYLKRFYELEDGYRKLLGIILIGQTELKDMFSESQHVDMREVIRRVQVAEIRGLNGNLKDYLSLKFKRVGRPIDEIMDDDAFSMLARRLTTPSRDGRTQVSHAYPLLVNNYAARALNLAYEMGEAKVTSEVIEAI